MRIPLLIVAISACLFPFGKLKAQSTVPKLRHNPVRIYRHLYNPEDYPEYNKRALAFPTRQSMGNRLQFAINGIPFKKLGDKSYGYSAYGGKTYRIEETGLANADPDYRWYKVFQDSTFNLRVAGFKPLRTPGDKNSHGLADREGGFSERLQTLYDWLGPNMLGFQFGESDASFFNLGQNYVFPLSRKKENQAEAFRDYFEYYGTQANNYILAHINKGGIHHLMKEGIVTLAEAQVFYRGETAQPIHYAFIRGAAKQYGVLTSMGHSATTGTSYVKDEAPFSFFRRLIYLNYLYNGVDQTQEFATQQRNWKETDALVPRGQMVKDMANYIKENPNPGTMVTPVALFMDFNNGYFGPEKKSQEFQSWVNLPYSQGDFLTDNIFSMLYPGFERVGVYKNFRYDLTETPYGEMSDVILSDVRPEILDRYHLAVVTSEIEKDFGYVKKKLTDFASKGGEVVITAGNAKKLWPEWRIGSTENVPANAQIDVLEGESITEPRAFELYSIPAIPQGAETAMSWQNKPVCFELPIGEGFITVLMSPYGLNKDELGFSWDVNPDERNPLPLQRPYRLLEHAKTVYDAKLKKSMPFSVGEGLHHVVNAISETEYHVTVFNNTLEGKPFEIKSNIGEITSVEEVNMGERDIMHETEYYPATASTYNIGTSDSENIQGHDVRMFKVTVAPGQTSIPSEIVLEDKGSNRFLAMADFHSLRSKNKQWPAFGNEFEGAKFSGTQMLATSPEAVSKDAAYFNTRKFSFVFDLRDLTAEQIPGVLSKINVLDSAHVLMTEAPQNVNELLTNEKIKTYTGQAVSTFVFVKKRSDIPQDTEGKKIVLNQVYETWDDAYANSQKVNGEGTGEITDGITTQTLDIEGHTIAKNANRYLSLRKQPDLKTGVASAPSFFEYFGGVMVEAEYLHGISDEKALADKAWADSKGIGMVVDFTRDVDGFSKIVFEKAWQKIYEKGMAYAETVMDRMQATGLTKAVITMRALGKVGLEEGFTEIAQMAKDRNITLYIRNGQEINGASLRNKVQQLVDASLTNLEVAPSVETADGDSNFDNAKMIFLCKTKNSIFYPLSHLDNPINIAPYENSGAMLILDAEYINEKEFFEDLTELDWNNGPVIRLEENGDLFTLHCDATDEESYAWTKNGEKITSETSPSLSGNKRNDFGTYACEVVSNGKTLVSNEIIIEKPTPFIDNLSVSKISEDGFITVSNMTVDYDYIIRDGNNNETLSGTINAQSNKIDVNTLDPGNYSLILTNSQDGVYEHAFSIAEPTPVVDNIELSEIKSGGFVVVFNMSGPYDYTLSDSEENIVQSGTLDPENRRIYVDELDPGTYALSMTNESGGSFSTAITIPDPTVLPVPDPDQITDVLRVTPNPSDKGYVAVIGMTSEYQWVVYDLNGVARLQGTTSNSNRRIYVNTIPAGTYILQLTHSQGGTFSQQIILTH
ncbi:hypothetical protein FUAX_19180 [Fulvitalea axinellae]|uniref:Ig-like domain-containing protein n=1 Tax=Fulvitalea axinellae TaxID=1182444 RepID=A0AAU9CBD8_9BACT|nr:hypothetical protein FUAX_19180 [Fulvitalea axinellae]